MSTADEVLHEINSHLAREQALLAILGKKRVDDPELAELLDPLVRKVEVLIAHLGEFRDHLRLMAVQSRT